MMTAEFMLSKRPVLRFTAALFFLLKPHFSRLVLRHSVTKDYYFKAPGLKITVRDEKKDKEW